MGSQKRDENGSLQRRLAACEEQRDLAIERLAVTEQHAEKVAEQLQAEETRRREIWSVGIQTKSTGAPVAKALAHRKLPESAKAKAVGSSTKGSGPPSSCPVRSSMGLFTAASCGERSSWGSLNSEAKKLAVGGA